MLNKNTAAALAIAAAGLFAGVSAVQAADTGAAGVHKMGASSCKGFNICKGVNSCSGMNKCSGVNKCGAANSCSGTKPTINTPAL